MSFLAHSCYKVGMNTEDQDTRWMNMAVKLAEKGVGLTSPNPCVGAVIVHENQVIGSGFHEKPACPMRKGRLLPMERPEATRPCLRIPLCTLLWSRAAPPENATLYGSHSGTPFKRVVYGSQDPNPRHRGAAADILGRAGIQVTRGILEKECDHLIRGFRLNMLEGRPWVIAKSAMSLDGRISRSPERSQWLTNEKSRSFVHTLRAECDAILTGGNTMRLDNPSLTIRKPDRPVSSLKEQPWRIILTHNAASIPADSVCLTDEFRDRTLIVENVSSYLELLKNLYNERKTGTVLLEAGGCLVREFLKAGLVDEWVGFYAPIITGGGADGVTGGSFLEREAFLEQPVVSIFGSDVCIRGDVSYR